MTKIHRNGPSWGPLTGRKTIFSKSATYRYEDQHERISIDFVQIHILASIADIDSSKEKESLCSIGCKSLSSSATKFRSKSVTSNPHFDVLPSFSFTSSMYNNNLEEVVDNFFMMRG